MDVYVDVPTDTVPPAHTVNVCVPVIVGRTVKLVVTVLSQLVYDVKMSEYVPVDVYVDVPTDILPPAHTVIVWFPVITGRTIKLVVTILSHPVYEVKMS